MPISSDFTIDPINLRITHTSGTTVYTVNALYSYLESTFSGVSYIQYEPPMSASTPTNYAMINGWFIDETSLQFLQTGGISTSGYNLAIYTLTFGATYTAAVSSDIGKVVTDGTHTATLLAYNNTTKLWQVRAISGVLTTGAVTITSGTGAGTTTSTATGESIFSNLYTLGSPLQAATQLYISQGVNTLITSYWSTGHVDLVLPVQRAGTLLNSGSVTVYAREFGNTYNYYTVSLSSGGRTPVPISTSVDTAIVDAQATIAAFTGFTFTYSTTSQNLNNGNGSKSYDLTINCGGNSVQKLYEYLQYILVRGTTTTTNTNGTQGQLFLGLTGYNPIAVAPFGTFAGGKFFGAQGVFITNMAASDTQNYQLTADDGTTQVPPNIVSITINGTVSGDQIFVARSTGSASTVVNYAKYTLASSGNSSGSGTVTITTAIGSDEPQTGTLRILNASGTYDRYSYSSWTGSVFTLTSTLTATYNNNTMFVPIIDASATTTSISNTLIYSAAINVVVRVRKYASGAGNSILPFETTGQVTSTGLAVAAIRTTDGVAT